MAVQYKKVSLIERTEGGYTVTAGNKKYSFDKVIIATGGKSYPLTGSDGSGYRLAMRLGHSVTELKPSLIPLTSSSPLCRDMQGLSLKNVKISIKDAAERVIYTDFGEMMFTHYGVTGPVILSASSVIGKRLIKNQQEGKGKEIGEMGAGVLECKQKHLRSEA